MDRRRRIHCAKAVSLDETCLPNIQSARDHCVWRFTSEDYSFSRLLLSWTQPDIEVFYKRNWTVWSWQKRKSFERFVLHKGKVGTAGPVVIGGDFCSRDCGSGSQHRGHFLTLYFAKIVCLKRTERKWRSGRVWSPGQRNIFCWK